MYQNCTLVKNTEQYSLKIKSFVIIKDSHLKNLDETLPRETEGFCKFIEFSVSLKAF